jgi:DnaJ-class molecular chaperone
MIVTCPRCQGRGTTPWVHPTIRMYYRSVTVVELAQVRIYTYWNKCRDCGGCGRVIYERPKKKNPGQPRRG